MNDEHAHATMRNAAAPLVNTGMIRCWRCGYYIDPEQPWAYGVDDPERYRYRGPEHVKCGASSAG